MNGMREVMRFYILCHGPERSDAGTCTDKEQVPVHLLRQCKMPQGTFQHQLTPFLNMIEEVIRACPSFQ